MSDPRATVQQEFLAETQELVEALSRDLLLLDEAYHRNERIDPALINEIFRSVHTLKGIAGMFGYRHVGAVAHALEDLLEFRSFHRRLRQVMTHNVRPYERLLKGRTVSLVHAHFGVEGVYALPLARSLRVPLVTTFHGFDATTSKSALLTSRKPSWVYYALLRSRLADRGDLFICVSDFIREKIREHLAMLFRRHNRAASSLDDKLRTEAELMLDAIVAVRERHLS